MRKFIVGVLVGAFLFSGITAYAIVRLKSEEVSYNGKTVQEALDELYSRALTSGNCTKGVIQLDTNATNSIGNVIVDFVPSSFVLSYYDPAYPVGGDYWNGGVSFYDKEYNEDYILLSIPFSNSSAALEPFSKYFRTENNLILHDNVTWGTARAKVHYMACR